MNSLNISVLIPCCNESLTIAKVVADFRKSLPTADIYVYDNCSMDETARIAKDAGAIVRTEPLKGKGNVVRRMFADIDSDIYVLVDGDDTYDANSAPFFIETLLNRNLDMVSGVRTAKDQNAYRPGHQFGNFLLTRLVSMFFGNRLSDLLSGYRAFSRRFVKSFPALASGFEIETEFSVHALQLRIPMTEIPTAYQERFDGSESKLKTYRDGLRILRTIFLLVKEEKPFLFFTTIALLLAVAGLFIGVPVIMEFMQTGLVPRFPSAILAAALMVQSFLSLTCGMILDSVSRGRMENKRLCYLSYPCKGYKNNQSKRHAGGMTNGKQTISNDAN